MKKTLRIITLSIPLLFSCQKGEQTQPVIAGVEVSFKAVTESTKAALDDDWKNVSWNKGDAIAVWDGKSIVKYATEQEGGTVVFTSAQGIADGTEKVQAVYPFRESISFKEDALSITFPSEQFVPSGRYYDPDALIAAAYTDRIEKTTELKFYNLCSFLKFTVPSEDQVTEINLEGGEDEAISGTITLTFDKKGVPSVIPAGGGGNSIHFRSEDPLDGTYLIPILPCTLQEGLKVTLRTLDGRTAVHRIIAKDENDVVSAVVFRRDKINHYTVSFSHPVWRNAPQPELIQVSETSAAVRWSENDFANPEQDFAAHYLLSLYTDDACTAVEREVDFKMEQPANIDVPAFCFTGLDPASEYWLRIKDVDTDAAAAAIHFTTAAETSVVPGAQVAEGEIALKETFSQLTEGGDPVSRALGLMGGTFVSKVSELPEWSEADLSATRLSAWSEKTEGADYAGPGYVRAGDSSSQKDAVITPVLSNLADCATVEVSFKAAPFSSDYGATTGHSRLGECYAEVWVVNGDSQISAGIVELTDDPTQWSACKIEAYNVLPTSRIAIGGAYGEKTQTSAGKQYARIYLDDIQVKVLRYEETAAVVPPEVTLGTVFWSDVNLTWTCAGEPEGYRVYVDDELAATLESSVLSYHIKGLTSGTKHSVSVAALYNNKKDEGLSQVQYFTTGTVERLTKNLSPTSLAFAIENRAGDNSTNFNPLIEVELLDGPDPATANSVFKSLVLDAQTQSPASPFMVSLLVANTKPRTPLNVAIGNLSPGTDYWFRVRSVESAEFTNYQPSTPATVTCTSSNGTSEFSVLVKATTSGTHTSADNEILFQGFDELMIQADYVNAAVGTVPAFKAAGMKVGNMDYETIRTWTGGWSFYGLRTVFASSQLAPHYAWGAQQTSDNDLFKLSQQNANGTIKGTAPGVGAKVYKFKEGTGSLKDWYSSNNTFACQGYIELGAYYNASDSKAQVLGMIATPAIDNLDTETHCTLSFKGLVLQGRSCTLGVWRYSAAAKSWTKLESVALHNSAGSTEAVAEWSALADTHRWYDYSVDITLAPGDRVALDTDKQGAAVIDEIMITKKQ